MIAEKDSLKQINLKELEKFLLEQHYSERIIKADINKALEIPQNELINEQEERRFYLLFLPLIQTIPKPYLLLNELWKT